MCDKKVTRCLDMNLEKLNVPSHVTGIYKEQAVRITFLSGVSSSDFILPCPSIVIFSIDRKH